MHLSHKVLIMNVYDFDKTIYPVDSTEQFYLWCLRRYPRSRHTLLWTVWAGVTMALRLRTRTRAKQDFYRFLAYVPEDAPALFWQEHLKDINPWYMAQRQPDDVIISAGPVFLLLPVAEALGFDLIASPVDQGTGRYQGLNCDGAEKVRRFREKYGDAPVEGFWSDSRHDGPMAAQAAQAYIVRGQKISPW